MLDLTILREYLPFLIPLIIAQAALMIIALIHIIRHPHYRFGNRIMWILIVCLINTIGPIAYFIFGRGDE